MARIIVGSRGSALAIAETRTILTDLNSEWPNLNISQRNLNHEAPEILLDALLSHQIQIAVMDLPTLPSKLPEGVSLAAITKRNEPRGAFITKNHVHLNDLPQHARIGIQNERDQAFIKTARRDLSCIALSSNLSDDLARIANEDLDACILPANHIIQLGYRHRISNLLEPDLFPPAPGQGSLALLVNDLDDLSNEVAYTLNHRPSHSRILAERTFQTILGSQSDYAIGALATLQDDDLKLFGAVTHKNKALSIQAEITGEASEAQTLGKELAQDVLEQIKQQV